jgi:hypothetical protein
LAPSFTEINATNALDSSNSENYYVHEQEEAIISMADSAAEEVSTAFFLSAHLKYLNLKEVTVPLPKTNQIRNQFQQYIEVIARAIYLCADGCFCHPNGSKSIHNPNSNTPATVIDDK